MKRRPQSVTVLALLLFLASPALAQVQNPNRPDLREEGVSQGRIFALNCVGVELLCAVSGGVGSITFSGASLLPPFTDTNAIIKGSGDPTKLLAFEVDGFTTGNTRTITVPNVSDTMAVLAANQTFTGAIDYNPSSANLLDVAAAVNVFRLRLRIGAILGLGTSGTNASSLGHFTTQTPDTILFTVPSLSNHVVFAEEADKAFDFAHAQQTNPTLFGQSRNQTTTEWWSLTHTGAHVVLGSGLGPVGLAGGSAVASATALPLPTGNVFHVTGTTNVTSITSTNFVSGVCITLIFDGILTFTDGNNLKLAGNLVTTADDTISLCYDGTNFYETARAVN